MSQVNVPTSVSRRQVAPARRVLLLGASNLTKGIHTVLDRVRTAWSEPLEILTALGRGRSYCRASTLLGRELPGILECGLWDRLPETTLPLAALVTDIGNDLLYEEPPERVAERVEACLDRLTARKARTIVTALPVANLATLSPARFRLLRTVFFPHSRIRLEELVERCQALDERVRRMAMERGCAVATQRAAWYGFDKIHIRRRERVAAWREILSAWLPEGIATAPARTSLAARLYVRSRQPARRRLFGIERRAAQPAARLKDGTTIAFY